MQVSRVELVLAAANSSLGRQQRAFQQLQQAGCMVPAITSSRDTAQLSAHMAALRCTSSFVPLHVNFRPAAESVQLATDMQLPRVVFLSGSKAHAAKHALRASKWFSCQPVGAFDADADVQPQALMDASGQPALALEVGLGLMRVTAQQAQTGMQGGWYPALVAVAHGSDWARLGSLIRDWADAVIIEGNGQNLQPAARQHASQLQQAGLAVFELTPGWPRPMVYDLWHPEGRCKGSTQRSSSLREAIQQTGLVDSAADSRLCTQLHAADELSLALTQGPATTQPWPQQVMYRQECAAQMPAAAAEPSSHEQIDQLRRQRMQQAASSLGQLPYRLRLVHQLLSLESASVRVAAFHRCRMRPGASWYVTLLPQH